MKNLSKYLYFVLLIFGAILASNVDGSTKAIGIVFIAISVTKTPSIINCNIKLKR